MDWKNYISVLTAASGAGTILFHLETFNAQTNIALTIPVTSTGAPDEITLALRIQNQVNTILVQASASYQGGPVFSDQEPQATFDVTRSDHCVCIWSQAEFRLRMDSNDTGAQIRIGPSPTLITLPKAKAYAPLMGVTFSDFNEVDLTDDQIIQLLEIASDQIGRLINNNIVISTYLHEAIGNMVGTMRLGKGPLVDWDVPYIRRPYIILITAIPLGQSAIAYNVVRNLKLVNYRFTNSLMNLLDPYEMNNEIKMTYRAGFMNIPTIVQEKVIQMASIMLNDANVKTLKGGSFSVEFRLPTEVLDSIARELKFYRNDGN